MTHTTEELERLMAEATPGPWKADPYGGEYTFDIVTIGLDEYDDRERWIGEIDEWANAALIVAAVNALPELLAIKKAVQDYHFALDSREHGGIAANKLVDAVQAALGQHWVRGAEAQRRAALSQEAGS